MSGPADSAPGASSTPPIRRPLPKFDPEPSSRFAARVLRESGARGALIGRVAVWAWIDDPAQHEFTKDVDLAVSRADLRRVRDWLQQNGYETRELSIGGVNVTAEEGRIRLDFIERSAGDLSPLFEEAVEIALKRDLTIEVAEGVRLPLAPAEHVVAMKIATAEDKDRRDAKRLLGHAPLDVGQVRAIARRHLGAVGANALEVLLREMGHPAAKPGYGES